LPPAYASTPIRRSPTDVVAAATTSVGDLRIGVLAYAGGNNVGDADSNVGNDGNASVTASDSDTGPDGSASGTVTFTSAASASHLTISSTASTSQTDNGSVSFNPAHVYLDTVLGEAGQWSYEGSFDTQSSNTDSDACISGTVRFKIYPPGEDNETLNLAAQVNSCENGSGHAEFGDIDDAGVVLAAGSKIELQGSLTNPNSDESGTSSASFSLEVDRKPVTPVVSTGAPTLTGTGVVGTELSSTAGTWDGEPDTFTYQWRSGGSNVVGANASTYTVRAADVGKLIVCRVTASKGSSSATRDSAGITGKASTPPPTTTTPTPTSPAPTSAAPTSTPGPTSLANTAPPAVSGKFVVGKTLSATAGTWSHPPSSTTFQWLRNGSPIKGATGATYKLTNKDKGKKVSVTVTAKATGYLDGTSTSAAKKVKPKPKPKPKKD